MAIDKSGSALVVFAMLASSSVALASNASHSSIAHPKVWPDAQTHRHDGEPSGRMPAARHKNPVDDPLGSLLLG